MVIDVLRDRLGLKGAKIGCDRGVCGACTILINGDPTAACSTFAWRADGAPCPSLATLTDDAVRGGGADRAVEEHLLDAAAHLGTQTASQTDRLRERDGGREEGE